MIIRYIDRYRKEEGHLKFASRVLAFDYHTARPITPPDVRFRRVLPTQVMAC